MYKAVMFSLVGVILSTDRGGKGQSDLVILISVCRSLTLVLCSVISFTDLLYSKYLFTRCDSDCDEIVSDVNTAFDIHTTHSEISLLLSNPHSHQPITSITVIFIVIQCIKVDLVTRACYRRFTLSV